MNDIERIKEMTNQKIAYSIYERKEKNKMKTMKKITVSLCVCLLVIGGGVGVDATNGGKMVKRIQKALQITLNGDEVKGNTYTDENGDVWVKVKDKNGNESQFNKTYLEKENIDIDMEDKDDTKTITLKPSK